MLWPAIMKTNYKGGEGQMDLCLQGSACAFQLSSFPAFCLNYSILVFHIKSSNYSYNSTKYWVAYSFLLLNSLLNLNFPKIDM